MGSSVLAIEQAGRIKTTIPQLIAVLSGEIMKLIFLLLSLGYFLLKSVAANVLNLNFRFPSLAPLMLSSPISPQLSRLRKVEVSLVRPPNVFTDFRLVEFLLQRRRFKFNLNSVVPSVKRLN